MSVHNCVPNTPHNSEHNSEDETDLNNVVILISKLDLSHPLHLHPNDSTTLTIVSYQIKGCTCHAAEDFKKHNQLMKLMQFLMDLDDSYMKTRSNILSRDPLPDAKGAYVLISCEESHRAVVTGSGAGSSQRVQSFVFNFSVNNRGSTQRSQNFGNTSRSNNVFRPNISNNRRTAGGPILAGIIFDSGANKPLTYIDKDLVNVIDISYLEIIVSHPNGTQDLITKVARDSKFIVGFDELKHFLIYQDLMDVKIMRIGRQVNGLYYIDNLKVLSVLKNDICFENKSDNVPCDICQRDKQTREHFPLSEHKSTILGELVHLDLWGPYKAKPSVIPLEQNASITSEPSDSDPVIDNITEY
ncbi:hypothetical protein Tco_0407849 [Tanacetum coccineum]